MNVGYYQERKLTSIPRWVYDEELNILHLFGNNLNQSRELIIPKDIDFLLTINNNKLRQMPSNTNALNKLEFLDASDNLISELTSDVGQMICLKQLTMCNNPLTSLTENICEMKNLKSLWLSNCELKKIPESVCETLAKNKTEMHIDGNKFPYTGAPGGWLYFLNDRYISVNNKIIQTKDYEKEDYNFSISQLTSQILQRNGLYLTREDNRATALARLIIKKTDQTEIYNLLRAQKLSERMETLPKIIEWNNFDSCDYHKIREILLESFEEGTIELKIKRWLKKETYKLYL